MYNTIFTKEEYKAQGFKEWETAYAKRHDILFNKYSKAPTTTLVVKDRVTVHNTVAPLYAANTFYAKKLR